MKTKASVLIIDDEPFNLRLIEAVLRKNGYLKITLLSDPRLAIETVKSVNPDLILLDIKMPHLDGFEVMRRLREVRDSSCPPIVVLTAENSQDFLNRALSEGAQDFLGKPFNSPELLLRVKKHLQEHLEKRLLSAQKCQLEELVQEKTRQLYQSRLQIVHQLAKAVKHHDNETGAHILRVSHMAEVLARHAGWSTANCELILHASPLHDVGKIGIPDAVLLKPGGLTAEERSAMEKHSIIGANILEGSSDQIINMARDIALSHHEKWDGSGYPHRLSGDAIPMAARITAIADVFDALTSDRPYKKPWSLQDAKELIVSAAGTHFDPNLVEVFVSCFDSFCEIYNRFNDEIIKSNGVEYFFETAE